MKPFSGKPGQRRALDWKGNMKLLVGWYKEAVNAYPERGHSWGLYCVTKMWLRHLEHEGFIKEVKESRAAAAHDEGEKK